METTATLMANVKGIFSRQKKTNSCGYSNQIGNGQFINFFDKFIVLVHQQRGFSPIELKNDTAKMVDTISKMLN